MTSKTGSPTSGTESLALTSRRRSVSRLHRRKPALPKRGRPVQREALCTADAREPDVPEAGRHRRNLLCDRRLGNGSRARSDHHTLSESLSRCQIRTCQVRLLPVWQACLRCRGPNAPTRMDHVQGGSWGLLRAVQGPQQISLLDNADDASAAGPLDHRQHADVLAREHIQ